MNIKLPKRGPGRPSPKAQSRYQDELIAFADAIKEINSSLDFKVSSRGWCYLLEEYGLNKSEFNKAQGVINICRKAGLLPVDICAEDKKRESEGIIDLDNDNIEEFASELVEYIKEDVSNEYISIHPSDYQDYYIEIMLEKVDLKGIFRPVCDKYYITYYNAGGWSDLITRVSAMKRFKHWETKGKQCVLLYCGDHDPGGLQISKFIRSNMVDMEKSAGWSSENLKIDRFGLNYDFIQENNLTWIENLETGTPKAKGKPTDLNDPDHEDHNKSYVVNYIKDYGPRKVEANALVTREKAGQELCEKAILKYLDLDSWDKYNHDLNILRQSLQDEIIKQINQ